MKTEIKTAQTSCKDGGTCQTPPGGGACGVCGYPIAYAHPSSLIDAFRVKAIWICGTAIPIKAQAAIRPGVVRVLQRDGSCNQHPIPKDEGRPSEGLNIDGQTHLLEEAARLLCRGDSSSSKLSMALVDGLAALSRGWLSPGNRKLLECFLDAPTDSSGYLFYRMRPRVRALLQEVDRRDRLERSIVGPGLTWDDNRPSLGVACAAIGPFSVPLSHLRIALLPGEADHVDLYDVRVGERLDYPIGTSVISRLSEYGPGTVREIPGRVDIGGTLVGRCLPGAVLAGQLRDGADPTHPGRLSPSDLLGGVKLDLGRTFPPMSYVYLFYRVAPGHIFCAVVEPIEITQESP